MRAMQLSVPGEPLQLVNRDPGKPGPGQVRVKGESGPGTKNPLQLRGVRLGSLPNRTGTCCNGKSAESRRKDRIRIGENWYRRSRYGVFGEVHGVSPSRAA